MEIENTIAFREEYRTSEIGEKYSGKLHFWFMTIWCLALIITSIILIHQPTWKELLIIPVGFLYINFAEYFAHKGPMHHRSIKFDKVFIRHTLQHHRFFTKEKFSFDTSKDVKAVLFPPVLLLFFFFAFTLPVGLLFYFLWSANAALLFIATVFSYYLNYEWLHFAYHLPETHFVSKLPFIRTLRKLHHAHHDTQLMTKYNFNITYPIFDVIFGTYYVEK
ncbi:MAG: sterol desaturase family protein [Chitinophagales bacterium]